MKIASIPAALSFLLAAIALGGCLARPARPAKAPPATPPEASAPIAAAPPAANAWRPILFNALKYNTPTDGPRSRQVSRELGIPTLPIAYHGGVDWYSDGAITARDKELFKEWIERSVPVTYRGPICLDYEAPYWGELCARDIAPNRLAEILSVYDEGLSYARSLRPNAAWGYWGFPAMRHTSPAWKKQGHSLKKLLLDGGAVYPAAYDCHPGPGNTESFREYVSQVLEDVGGKRPVYPFVWNRFCGQGGKHVFASDDEMLANVDAVLRATWTDPDGVVHRVAGVVLWDSFKLAKGQSDKDLDERHAGYLEKLDALVKSHALVAATP